MVSFSFEIAFVICGKRTAFIYPLIYDVSCAIHGLTYPDRHLKMLYPLKANYLQQKYNPHAADFCNRNALFLSRSHGFHSLIVFEPFHVILFIPTLAKAYAFITVVFAPKVIFSRAPWNPRKPFFDTEVNEPSIRLCHHLY